MRLVQVFGADPGSADVAVGCLVVEGRRRRKAEYAGLGGREIRALVKEGGRERLLEDYRTRLPGATPPLRFGSWIGGDTDGNPNAGPATVAEALDRARRRQMQRRVVQDGRRRR